jgi:hypothetical protein
MFSSTSGYLLLLHHIKKGGRQLLAHIGQSPALRNNKQLRIMARYKDKQ